MFIGIPLANFRAITLFFALFFPGKNYFRFFQKRLDE